MGVERRSNRSRIEVVTTARACLGVGCWQCDCGWRVSGPCYVTVTLMTFDSRTPVERPSNRSRIVVVTIALKSIQNFNYCDISFKTQSFLYKSHQHACTGCSTMIAHSLYHCEPKKTMPLLFLQYLWFMLTGFNNLFAVRIRNDQHIQCIASIKSAT